MKGTSRISFRKSRSEEIERRSSSSSPAGPTGGALGRWAGLFVVGALVVGLIVCAMGSTPMAAQASPSRAQQVDIIYATGQLPGDPNPYRIVKSLDGGQTWEEVTRQNIGLTTVLAKHPDDNYMYAVAGGNVWRSEDGGATWTEILSYGVCNDIAVHPTNPQTLFAACGHQDNANNGVWKSTDRGQTWSRIWIEYYVTWPYTSERVAISQVDPNLMFMAANIYIVANGPGRIYRSTDGQHFSFRYNYG